MLERLEKHRMGEGSQLGLQPLQLLGMACGPWYARPEGHLSLQILKSTVRVEWRTLDPDGCGAFSGITPTTPSDRKWDRGHQHHPSLHHTSAVYQRFKCDPLYSFSSLHVAATACAACSLIFRVIE
jgi:hypothetical protein